jgi:hypothetical protein
MKKVVLVMAALTMAAWFSTSSLLLSGLRANADALETVALGMEDEDTFRPAEFSAEVNLDEYKDQSAKVDGSIVEQLDKAKQDLKQVCGSVHGLRL